MKSTEVHFILTEKSSLVGKAIRLIETPFLQRNKKRQDAFKPVARHFNLPNHSKQHIAVCGLSLHLGSAESCKTLEQKFIFHISTLNPHSINEHFLFNQFIPVFSSPHSHQFLHINPHTTHNSSNCSDKGLTLKTSHFKLFTVANLHFQLSC